MKNANYSQYFIDFEYSLKDLNISIAKFINYIYEQFPNTENNYVFFWQAINEDAYKNICKISKSFSLNMFTNEKSSKSDYCIEIRNYSDLEILKMILKSHSLNTLFVASGGPIKIDFYINSTKNPVANSNVLFDSYDFAIYIDLDWSINLTFNNKFISKKEVLHIVKSYMQFNSENLKIRDRL